MGKIARITNDGKLLLKGEVIEYPSELNGRRNLISKSIIGTTAGSTDTSEYSSNGVIKFSTSHAYGGVYVTAHPLLPNTEYVMSYRYKKTSGTLESFGGHTDASWNNTKAYVDGVGGGRYSAGSSVFVADDDNEHEVVIYITTPSEISVNHEINIQPNRGSATPIDIDIYDLKLEKGNIVTEWTPAPEDLGLEYSSDIDYFATGFKNNGDLFVSEIIEKEIVPTSLSFNNDYLQLPLINSVRSVMMKIKIPTQSTARWGYIIDARSGLATGYMGTGGAGGDFVKMYIDGNIAPTVSFENIPKDRWISLYIEGRYNFNDDINIFSRSGSIQGVIGELSEVQVWNKALSQEEIITYGEGVSGEEEGLLAYYPVTSTTSDTLIDVVNNYHGQISSRVILKKDNAILRLRSNSLELYGELIENSNLE